jgi:hypothetical protein
MRLPALARRHPADHLGAVSNRLLGMERALLAGEALADYLGVFVDEYAHKKIYMIPCRKDAKGAKKYK